MYIIDVHEHVVDEEVKDHKYNKCNYTSFAQGNIKHDKTMYTTKLEMLDVINVIMQLYGI